MSTGEANQGLCVCNYRITVLNYSILLKQLEDEANLVSDGKGL